MLMLYSIGIFHILLLYTVTNIVHMNRSKAKARLVLSCLSRLAASRHDIELIIEKLQSMRMRIRGTSPLTRCSSSTSSSYHHNAPILRLSQLLILLLVVCALLLDTVAAADLDYWKILGLRRGASDTDIKKAYRKLSKKFHPDKNKSEDAEQRFVEVSQGA
jgi:preprotein translocase subunit Sec63